MKGYSVRKVELKRFEEKGSIYFVTCVTENRVPVFRETNFALATLEALEAALNATRFSLIAYVLLPDHLHLLAQQISDSIGLSEFMKRFKGRSAVAINRLRSEKGRVWQHQFLDHILRSDEDFHNHMDYIHWNPVKHGLVDRPEDYSYSSYRFYERGEKGFVTITPVPM